VTVSPTADTEPTDGVFVTEMVGVCEAGTDTADGFDVIGDGVDPPGDAGGGVPDAVAESSNDPKVRSAWVTT
jgi:hypothetical protein